MTGRPHYYDHLPIFFGALPSIGVRLVAIGDCNPQFETQQHWWKLTTIPEYKKLWKDPSTTTLNPVQGTSVMYFIDKGLLKGKYQTRRVGSKVILLEVRQTGQAGGLPTVEIERYLSKPWTISFSLPFRP